MTETAGPFETERGAASLPAVRAIYDAMASRTGPVTEEHRQAVEQMCSALITGACEQAGVELGAYDRRITGWLGGWEPQICAVVAGLIHRAHETGAAGARND